VCFQCVMWYTISCAYDKNIENSLHRYQAMCETRLRAVRRKTRNDDETDIFIWTRVSNEEKWRRKRDEEAEKKVLGEVKGRNEEHRIRNESIRNELQIYSIKDKLDETAAKWRGYILKMDEVGLPKAIISCKATGGKLQGRFMKKKLNPQTR
jgi:hypothetical protein